MTKAGSLPCPGLHRIIVISDWNPEELMLLATLCYVKQNGCTLMVFRNKKLNDIHEGKWNGLGEKFEPGESPEECVIREVLEE